MVDDFLTPEANQIRSLIGKRETEAARASVEAALQSKFEGLQSLALQVLGSWRSKQSKQRLRSYLEDKPLQQSGSLVGVAAHAFRNRVDAGDAPWLLDLYFGSMGPLERYHLLTVLDGLPSAVLVNRVQSELQSSDRAARQAAVVLRNRLRSRNTHPVRQ